MGLESKANTIERSSRWEDHPFHQDLTKPGGFEHFLMQQDTDTVKEGLIHALKPEERLLAAKHINFADEILKGQMREDGVTPHLKHVLRVSSRLVKMRTEGANVPFHKILAAIGHDSEEDFIADAPTKAEEQELFRQKYSEILPLEDPINKKVYEGTHALNKFGPDGEKKKEDYYEDITAAGLWDVKCMDRIDSLVGDISASIRNGRGEKSLKRIVKSRGKAALIAPFVEEHAPEVLPYLQEVLSYADSFVGELANTEEIAIYNGRGPKSRPTHF